MTSRAIGWQVQLLDGVSLLGGIGETVSHAKPLPNVKAQGMAGRSPCHSLPLLVGSFDFDDDLAFVEPCDRLTQVRSENLS
jgi:hypothetical protein